MAYSEARVIAGGLAHIPILIGIFWFINSYFNKRRNNFEKVNNPAKEQPITKQKIKVAEKPAINKAENKASEVKKVENKASEVKSKSNSSDPLSSEIETVAPKSKENTKIDKKILN